jgi:GNAT superfamily N-acetyltransferase
MSSIPYFATRRLLVEGPGSIDSGAWPITWFRIAKGWGMLPEAYWPFDKRTGFDTANEPPNVDEIAKRTRLVHYQRLRSEQECLYAVLNHRAATAALEVSQDWKRPAGGRIPLSDQIPQAMGIHSIPLAEFDFETNSFVFSNSWGENWGDGGVGYLPYGYLTRFMTEAWTFPVTKMFLQASGPGIDVQLQRGETSLLGIPLIVNIQNGDTNESIAWAHAVLRKSVLDVEEVFVRPHYRRHGFGTALVQELRKVLPDSTLIRFWIPWGDHCEINAPQLIAWSRKLGLRLEPSGVRWAAFYAAAGQPINSLPSLEWMPSKATSPIQLVHEVDEEVGVSNPISWDDEKAMRRAELVEKKFRSVLTEWEQSELDSLQDEFGKFQDSIAPLPLD